MQASYLALAVTLALFVTLEHPSLRVAHHRAVMASSEEIVSENFYVEREPVANSKGQVHLHIEVLCD